jgi:hypothetical protein
MRQVYARLIALLLTALCILLAAGFAWLSI